MPPNLRTRLLLLLPALLLALGLGAHRYQANLDALREGMELRFNARHELTENYLMLLGAQVDAMQQLLLNHYLHHGEQNPALRALRRGDGDERWGLSGLAEDRGAEELNGTATGIGRLPLPAQTLRELNAAMALDALFAPLLRRNPQISWVYYTSAQHFMYLAPKTPLAEFHFEHTYLSKPFWAEAVLPNNPQRRQIVSSLYEDAGGKDLMITLSAPVYDGDQLLGVVSLDLGIELLRRLTGIGPSQGETLLVDERGRIVVRDGNFGLNEQYRLPPDGEGGWHSFNGNQWLGRPMLDGELWLLHQIATGELYWQAAVASGMTWLLIALALVLYGFAWQLFFALRRMTLLTLTDPLTRTLNRRGFYDKAGAIRALAERQRLRLALLLMDVDHFKAVNDRFGHAEGDLVLKQAAAGMLRSARPSDLICRWGGEEFAVLLTLPDSEQALQVAERVRQAARARVADDQPVTLSGGLVLLGPEENLDAAIRRADELLYRAKERGRNRIECEG